MEVNYSISVEQARRIADDRIRNYRNEQTLRSFVAAHTNGEFADNLDYKGLRRHAHVIRGIARKRAGKTAEEKAREPVSERDEAVYQHSLDVYA